MDIPDAYKYSAVRADMDRLDKISRARCKPGHTYNENIGKCLPGNPYSIGKGLSQGSGGQKMPKMGKSGGNSGKSANMAIAQEAAMRKSQGLG